MLFKKPLTPRQHSILDLCVVAARAGVAIYYAKSRPRAAIGALVGAALGSSYWALTDMPLTPVKAMSYRTHLIIDGIQAPLMVAMPFLLGFSKKREADIFYADAFACAVLTAASVSWTSHIVHTERVITATSMGPAEKGSDKAMAIKGRAKKSLKNEDVVTDATGVGGGGTVDHDAFAGSEVGGELFEGKMS